MPQPPAYNRTKDFTQNFGSETDHSGLNAELDKVSNSVNDIRTNLAILQADDGKLRPEVVTADSLSPELADALTNSIRAEVADARSEAVAAAAEAVAARDAVVDLGAPADGTVTDEKLSPALWATLGKVVDSIADLKALSKARYSQAFVTGYYEGGDGGGGAYYLDASDTASSDNGGTVIVAIDGGRWKLRVAGEVTVRQFGAKGDGSDDRACVQAAISFACANNKRLVIDGGFSIGATLNFPAGSSGCSIEGVNRKAHLKFTGAGALFSAVSTSHLQIRNLTLVGPGSAVSATAISAQTSDPTKGVYYCAFEGLTIEGFMYGMSVAGLCEATFKDIKIGLAKSGLFSGTDAEASPLIGISIGTAVLACQFEGLTIFAKQRCVQQTTAEQLAEGLYFWGCTFDLSFNSGTSADQSCVYFESGQDIVFTGCWFTNTQKYAGTSAPYSDTLLRLAHTPGSISAPIVALKFNGCTFAGNSLSLQFGNNAPLTREVAFTGCVFRLWANLGQFVLGGALNGFVFEGNVVQLYGDSAANGTKYNLPSTVFSFSNMSNFAITGNSVAGVLPIDSAVAYMTLGDTAQGIVANNSFPPQSSLSAGNDVSVQGTKVDVVVLGTQQVDARQLSTAIADGVYNTGNATIASINTHLTKPRMAIVEAYVDNAGISNPGGSDMFFRLEGLVADSDQYPRLMSTGSQAINITRVGLVSGTVSLKVQSSLEMNVNGGSSYKRHLKITFLG